MGLEIRQRPPVLHVYVCTEYPSVTEIFVASEMRAMVEVGHAVAVYPLRPGPSRNPATIPYLAAPTTAKRLLPWLPMGAALLTVSMRAGLRFRKRNFTRLMYAAAHAARLRWHLRNQLRRATQATVVLHAHFLDRPADVVALAASSTSVQIVTVHAGDSLRNFDPRLRAWRLSSFDQVICASEFVEKNIREDFPSCPTAVIHCGVPTDTLLREQGHATGDPLNFCTVARLVPKKNHRYAAQIIEAFAREANREVIWHVVGAGPQLPILQAIEKRWNDTENLRIVLYGARPHNETLDVLRRADIFLLPSSPTSSDLDGIPVALMEAMALGVLCVTSTAGGIPELVVDNTTGLLATEDDALDCARRLVRLLDTDEHDMILKNARKHVVDRFDCRASALKLHGVTKALQHRALSEVT